MADSKRKTEDSTEESAEEAESTEAAVVEPEENEIAVVEESDSQPSSLREVFTQAGARMSQAGARVMEAGLLPATEMVQTYVNRWIDAIEGAAEGLAGQKQKEEDLEDGEAEEDEPKSKRSKGRE